MAKFFQTIKEKYNQYSGIYFFIRLSKAALRKMGLSVEHYNYYVNDLAKDISALDMPEDFVIRQIVLTDIDQSSLIPFSNAQKELYRNRLEQWGYECYGIYAKGIMVYYFSISLKVMESPLPKHTIELNADEGLLVDGYCHPDYRGKKLHTAMSVFLLRRLKEIGKTKAVTFIIKENLPAKKSQEKIGFKLSKQISLVKVFGKKIVSIKAVKK